MERMLYADEARDLGRALAWLLCTRHGGNERVDEEDQVPDGGPWYVFMDDGKGDRHYVRAGWDDDGRVVWAWLDREPTPTGRWWEETPVNEWQEVHVCAMVRQKVQDKLGDPFQVADVAYCDADRVVLVRTVAPGAELLLKVNLKTGRWSNLKGQIESDMFPGLPKGIEDEPVILNQHGVPVLVPFPRELDAQLKDGAK